MESARPEPLPPHDFPAAALAALGECDADLDALERGLLAVAVHPAGAGAARAWLARWDARRERLVLTHAAARADVPGALAHAIGRARREPPPRSASPAWSAAPATLSPPLAEAWGAGAPGPAEDALAPWAGEPLRAAVRLQRSERPVALLVAAWEGAADAHALARLAALAEPALLAQARAAEARRRARQVTALGEFARAAVSAVHLSEALHLVARLAAHGTLARGAALWRTDAGGTLLLEVAHGPAALREPAARALAAVASGVAETRRARAGGRESLAAGARDGVAAWAMVPLAAYGRTLGALGVWAADEPAPSEAELDRADLEFLSALADHAALLVEHAHRLEELAAHEARRGELAARLRDQERLVSLGELAERVAEESRNPLASIAAFARRAHRALAEGDPQREYLEIVLRESERLDAMLREQLEYARLERPRLALRSLNAVVQEGLQRAGDLLTRRRVRLTKKLAPDLPELLLDGPRIQRVIENVLAFALENVPPGGRVRVESRRVREFVLVEIAHDGGRSAGDLLEQLFVPFAQGPGAGAAVGLGVAQQIVREHGGEIRVRNEGESGVVFSFTLPVAGNEDRRRAGDRRASRGDRRRRAPGA